MKAKDLWEKMRAPADALIKAEVDEIVTVMLDKKLTKVRYTFKSNGTYHKLKELGYDVQILHTELLVEIPEKVMYE